MDVVVTEVKKLQVRMVTGRVVRVQLEAGRDGVNTTKAAVVEGFPLEQLVELKRMNSEEDKTTWKRRGAAASFFACLCFAALRRGTEKWCASTKALRMWWR